MFKSVLHIATPAILAALGACSGSTAADTPDSTGVTEPAADVYANAFGEIHLTEINDTLMRAVFFDNNGQTFDTLMYIDYDYTIIYNDSLPFLWLETGGIKMLENRLEVYDFAGPAYMQMYTGIPEIYEHPFYKLNDTVLIEDAVEHSKGGETIGPIYVQPISGYDNQFVKMNGVVHKEKFPRDYYSTADGPQGMFADTNEVHYRLVITPVETTPVAEFVYEGYKLNVDGQAAIVWEYADSEAYYLSGHAPWTEKEEHEKIRVEGVLHQFDHGKSVLKSWTILD